MKTYNISFPLTNTEFLRVVSNSFSEFINSRTSRSTAKLKPLHGGIAKDLAMKLGEEYQIMSQGYGEGTEGTITGRYIDKKVDITILHNKVVAAGIAVKFVMQNYSQNSNNYFENMLGETANIRCNNYPYFQIFIILDKLPYYKKNKTISNWETFSSHNAAKYITLSKDNIDAYYHTPNKTLIYVVHIPDSPQINNLDDYMDYYAKNDVDVTLSAMHFDDFKSAAIINNYEQFVEKVYHTIKAL